MREYGSPEHIAVDERVGARKTPGAKGPGYEDEAH